MRITIMTWGSSGDVIPYIALALGLVDKGHQVTLAVSENFFDLVSSYGIPAVSLHGDTQKLLDSEQGRKLLACGNIRSFMKEFAAAFTTIKEELMEETLAACGDAECIICGTILFYHATTLSEKLKLPLMLANVNPINVRTRAFPHFLVSYKNLRFGALNRLSYTLFFKTVYKQLFADCSAWRNKLGLGGKLTNAHEQLARLNIPVMYGFSQELLPRPGDWRPNIYLSGVWKTPERHRRANPPLPEFDAWVRSGGKPVYFGFGSMPVTDPAAFQQMVIEICRETKTRAILHAGWSKFDISADHDATIFYLTKHIDLDWLFPKCCVLVHHGGVGTTHLGIEAGVPAVVCSIFADNPLWGERLEDLGIGKHIPFKKVSKVRLKAAIIELNKDAVREKTARIGKKMAEESGLANAVDFIETYLPQAPVYQN
jgi:sterol 3beta-glucosyltransferase